jgi:hypothetical protein
VERDPLTLLHTLTLLSHWLQTPLEPEQCPTCGQETGDTASLSQWPRHTHCPHCGADLVPF